MRWFTPRDETTICCDAQAGGNLGDVSELRSRPRLCAVGLVIDRVDWIMHGMEPGTAGMHNQVRQWARQGFMRNLLGILRTQGFQVYLALDHGNIEAISVGRPAEGTVVNLCGERGVSIPIPGSGFKSRSDFRILGLAVGGPLRGLPRPHHSELGCFRAGR